MVSVTISRCSILIFGFLYPAYRSYKAVKNRDVREYVKWMMYWIVWALFTCVETLADYLVAFWMPFYYELKIIFLIWLLSPYTKGATYIYRKVIHPAFAKHEDEIDMHIELLRTKSTQRVLLWGSQGMEYAKEMVANLAVRSQLTLVNQLKKSYSLNDLDENPMAAGGGDYRKVTQQRLVHRAGDLANVRGINASEVITEEDELLDTSLHPSLSTGNGVPHGLEDEDSGEILVDQQGQQVVLDEFRFLGEAESVVPDTELMAASGAATRSNQTRRAKDDANLRIRQTSDSVGVYGTLPRSGRGINGSVRRTVRD